MNTFSLAPLILVFPIVGVLFNGLIGRRFVVANRKTGERWSGWFATAMVLSAFLVSLSLFGSEVSSDYHAEIVPLFTWISIPSADFYVPWAMQIDTLSVTMMLVVTGVGVSDSHLRHRLHAWRSKLLSLLSPISTSSSSSC